MPILTRIIILSLLGSAGSVAARTHQDELHRVLSDIPAPQLLWLAGVTALALVGVARFRNAR